MNQYTIEAICFMLSETPNDILRDPCFRKTIFYAPYPLLIYTGLGLDQHYVNSYLESHGQHFANCVEHNCDFPELSAFVSTSNWYRNKIAIDLFSNDPLIVEGVSPSLFNALWCKDKAGIQINLHNYKSILPKRFDAFTIKKQECSMELASSDRILSKQFEEDYLRHLPVLNIISSDEKKAVVANLNNFVQNALDIGQVNNDKQLIRSASAVWTTLQNGIPTILPNDVFFNEIKAMLDAIVI